MFGGISTVGLKYGSWIYYQGRLGILTKTRYNAHLELEEVHIVDKNRETVKVEIFDASKDWKYAGLRTEGALKRALQKVGE